MQWFATNWFWVLIGIAFVAMHLFGHGGHAGDNRTRHRQMEEPTDRGVSRDFGGHQH